MAFKVTPFFLAMLPRMSPLAMVYSCVEPVTAGAVIGVGAGVGMLVIGAVTAAVVGAPVVGAGTAVADGSALVVSVAVGSAAMSPLFGIDISAFVFGAAESVAGGLSLVQPWMSRPPMKTTCTIKIVKKA